MSQPTQILPNANVAALTRRIRSLGRLPWVRGGEIIEPHDSHLCERCDRLNLNVDAFIVTPGAPPPPRDILTSLGLRSAIRRKTFCPVCRLVCEIADRPSDQRTPTQAVAEDPMIYYKWVIDGQVDLGSGHSPIGHHVFQARTRRLMIYSDPQSFKDGYIVLLGDGIENNEFLGRRVQSHDLLDAEMIKGWLRVCESRHGKDCEDALVHPDLLRDIKDVLRAVDVDNMCIVEIPQTSRFVALSYLWGKNFLQFFTTSQNIARLSLPGALNQKDVKLPKTIKDSIQLTQMLGERYLWTDSLCLLHDDTFKYHDDWVYARSVLTIVAGSGKDANAGLAGVRKESRLFHQLIEEIRPDLSLMVSHLAEDYISTSQWDSRAWTFQERMLSRRCLLFVNGRIYFQCRRATFCEDMEPAHADGWSLDSVDMPTRIFKEPPFIQFTSAVELYTRRDLTNPNDILNAFEGVELVLEKRLQTPIFYGAFETKMDASLLWESTKKLKRREGKFPSWSWSGWIGEIQWKFQEEVRSWIRWDVKPSQGLHRFPSQLLPRISAPIPWHKHAKHIAKPQTKDPLPLLQFDTVIAFFKLVSPSHIHKAVISPLRKRLTGPSALSTVRPAPTDPGLIRAGIADKTGAWCGTIDLDEVWESRVGQPLQFLVMSKVKEFTPSELMDWEGTLSDEVEEMISKPAYGVYNVMLVRNVRGICFREGFGRILTTALEQAIEPGPVWENILLG